MWPRTFKDAHYRGLPDATAAMLAVSAMAALFIAALAACRGNSPIATAYKALLKAAKPKRVALTAIMRKIITIANARVRDAMQQQNEIIHGPA